jgi:hypothetical protein
MSRDVRLMLVVALAAAPWIAGGTDIIVGGPVGWGLGVAYDEVNASVGDVLVGALSHVPYGECFLGPNSCFQDT